MSFLFPYEASCHFKYAKKIYLSVCVNCLDLMNIKRKSNNFDLLRLFFAVVVAIVHGAELSKVDLLTSLSSILSSELAVDSFFIISGFLIFMSYESTSTLKKFVSKRIRRIFPGYWSVVFICAFVLFFTSSKGFPDYFSFDFFKYLLCNLLALNFLQPQLPGVFDGNSLQTVNAALWTIKIEVMFYFSVPFIAYLLAGRRKIYVLVSLYFLSICYSFAMCWLSSKYHSDFFMMLERQLPGQLSFFLSGSLLYYYYEIFYKYSLVLAVPALGILILDKFVVDLYIIYPISLAIVVIYFATIFKYLGNFGRFGDLSFGVYIWHFPILQLLLFYNLFSNPVLGVIVFAVCVLVASFLSWHLIEKRFLYKSSHYITSEEK